MNSPILLFGMPRSGTTWVGKIFDSHPLTLYRHEPDSVQRLSLPMFANVEEASVCSELVGYVHMTGQMRSPKVCAKLPVFPKRYLSTPRFMAYRLGIYLSKLASHAGVNLNVPAAPTCSPHRDDIRLVWKSIESLGRIGLIHRCLENAYAVHIIRHPCGYVASVLRGEAKQKFIDKRPSSEDYALFEMLLETPQARRHGLDMSQLRALPPEGRLAWRWVIYNEKAQDDLAGRPRTTTLIYDALCRDPLSQAREVFAACALDWHPQSEDFVRSSISAHQDAYYSVFKNPSAAADKWRRELSPAQIETVMAVVQRSRLLDLFPR